MGKQKKSPNRRVKTPVTPVAPAVRSGGGASRSSIKEIAQLAGVSIGTVDRVVHNRGRVSQATDIKVRRIIAEMGYKPNIFASRLSRGKVFRFAVLMPQAEQDSRFWELPMRGINRAADELRSQNIQVDYFFFDKYASSRQSFDRVCRRILAELPDGLLAAPVVPVWMKEFLEQLPESCPYVFFDSGLPGIRPLSTISQDSYQSGVLSARLADLLSGGTGELAIFQSVLSDFHLLERARGFRSYFEGRAGITCLEYPIDGARIRESFHDAFAELRRAHPDLRGVFVTNATTYHAADYLKRQRLARHVPVVGYDLIPENIRCLKQGSIDFLIHQRPEMQGYAGIYALYRHIALLEPVQACVMMPIDVITKENIPYYESEDPDRKECR